MKNSLMMMAAGAAVLFASCSANDDVVENIQTSSSNAIAFNAVNNNAQSTRASLINSTDELKQNNFKVYSYTNSDDTFMDGLTIKWQDNKEWDYENGNTYYWPATGSLDFYAVAPSSYTAASSKTITYNVSDEYGSESAAANVDVLFANAKGQTRTTNGGQVKLTFNHILSQVVFKAKTENSTMTATIGSIKIHNAATSNTYNFASGWGTATRKNNTLSVPVKTANVTSEVSSVTAENSTEYPMLMLPQTSTAWSVSGNTKSIAQANSANQTYLEITCNVKQNNVDILGSSTEYATIYVPFNATWEAGYKYAYTLIFGGGYDTNGDKQNNLTPITFTVDKVTDWVNAENQNIQY